MYSATMDRRQLLKSSLAAGAALALPTVPARAQSASPRDRKLAEIARQAQARAGSLLWRRDYVGVADFGLHSAEPRFHFVNLEAGRVESYLVSHGDGSDPEHDGWLNWFSNEHGSHCSSEGSYLTYSWYTGQFGVSIRLEGLDPTNSNALDRAIVMHRAGYAEPEHVQRWGRLGRSNGCFALSPDSRYSGVLSSTFSRCSMRSSTICRARWTFRRSKASSSMAKPPTPARRPAPRRAESR